MIQSDRPRVVPAPEQCVLPDIATGTVLAPLPAFRTFPWDPLGRGILKR